MTLDILETEMFGSENISNKYLFLLYEEKKLVW